MKYVLYLFFIVSAWATAQQPEVSTKVDRDLIKIGEEVVLEIGITAQKSDLVIFPEQPAYGALEVLESYPVDSVIADDKFQLFKKYGVTQWDSGDYWIPQLKVLINDDKQVLTDSLLVSVREVEVDTTKQKMFPIKDTLNIETVTRTDWSWLWWLLLLLPIGAIIYLLSRKREKKSYEDTLAPYEWAIYRLKQLENNNWLENRDWKSYYSEITYIIRRYIDSKVYGRTMESTTQQLLTELKVVMNEKGMHITQNSENRLESLLQKADLIKFAGASSDSISAKEDRGYAHDIIYNIHQVLPPPSEEELMLSAEYQRKQARKKALKKGLLVTAISLLVICSGIGIWTYLSGWDNVKDSVFGNKLRSYNEQEWYTAEYGLPSIQLDTPEILVRQSTLNSEEESTATEINEQVFEWKDDKDLAGVYVKTYQIPASATQGKQEINPQEFIDIFLKQLEETGASNILNFDSEITTNNIKGISITGSFEREGNKYDYETRFYATGPGVVECMVYNIMDDEELEERQYGQQLKERVIESLTIPSSIQQSNNKDK